MLTCVTIAGNGDPCNEYSLDLMDIRRGIFYARNPTAGVLCDKHAINEGEFISMYQALKTGRISFNERFNSSHSHKEITLIYL